MIKVKINPNVKLTKIKKEVYGHFAEHLGRCIYGGIWVEKGSPIPNIDGMRIDVIDALKKIKIPVLRWPGGCFADTYNWMDGIGDPQSRPCMVNVHWGGVTENNHFGTHEFLQLCELLECEPYICGNVGSGTVREMAQWVDYITFDGLSPMSNLRRENGRPDPWHLKYFGIGNESWGCGGNMRPEYYADVYRQYQTFVRNVGGSGMYRIACGANNADYEWTRVLMERAGNYMDGLSLHYYTVPYKDWTRKGSATDFTIDEWYETLAQAVAIDGIIAQHAAIMDEYDPDKKVGMIVDEWGTWFDVEPGTNPGFLYQQNTMRDALVAGATLNIFNQHADRIHMANIAQTINVLQAVILTEGDKMLLTPTYHVFDMYSAHQDGELLDLTITDAGQYVNGGHSMDQVSMSASIKNATITITLCNLSHCDDAHVDISLPAADRMNVSGIILACQDIGAYNTFQAPDTVCPKDYRNFRTFNTGIKLDMPAASIISLTLQK